MRRILNKHTANSLNYVSLIQCILSISGNKPSSTFIIYEPLTIELRNNKVCFSAGPARLIVEFWKLKFTCLKFAMVVKHWSSICHK